MSTHGGYYRDTNIMLVLQRRQHEPLLYTWFVVVGSHTNMLRHVTTAHLLLLVDVCEPLRAAAEARHSCTWSTHAYSLRSFASCILVSINKTAKSNLKEGN
jgi:hypothetical protein